MWRQGQRLLTRTLQGIQITSNAKVYDVGLQPDLIADAPTILMHYWVFLATSRHTGGSADLVRELHGWRSLSGRLAHARLAELFGDDELVEGV